MAFVYYCSPLQMEFTEFKPTDRCPMCLHCGMEDHVPTLILDMSEKVKEPLKMEEKSTSAGTASGNVNDATNASLTNKPKNPFYPNARIHAVKDGKVFRKGGNVIAIFCSSCDKCKEKNYAECDADITEKLHVYASFPKEEGGRKRFKYPFAELGFEEPLPLKQEVVVDLSHRDIRPLATAIIQLSLEDFNMMYSDDEAEEEHETTEEQVSFKSEVEEEAETDEEASRLIDEFFERECDGSDLMEGTDLGVPI